MGKTWIPGLLAAPASLEGWRRRFRECSASVTPPRVYVAEHMVFRQLSGVMAKTGEALQSLSPQPPLASRLLLPLILHCLFLSLPSDDLR